MGQGLNDDRWQPSGTTMTALNQPTKERTITERTQLEHEVKTQVKKAIVEFLSTAKAADAVKKLFETESLALGIDEDESAREAQVVSDILMRLRDSAVQLSPADLEVSTIIDLVSKGK